MFAKRVVDEQAKLHVARACVHSRLLLYAGMWPLLGGSLQKKIVGACYKPLRAVTVVKKAPAEPLGAHVSNSAVAMHLRALPVE